MPSWLGNVFGSTTGPQGATGAVGANDNYWTSSANVTGPTGNLWSISPSYPGTYVINSTSSVYSNGVDYSNNDIILKRNGKDDLHVGRAIDAIMERLCIIEPAFELLEKYPALREAYNNYKLIETMVKNGDHNDEQ